VIDKSLPQLDPIVKSYANVPRLREVTLQEVLSWRPCYESGKTARIATRFGESATAAEVFSGLRGKIPDEDMLWLLLRPAWWEAPYVVLRTLVCDFSQHALEQERSRGREPQPRSWESVRIARSYARGQATEEDLEVARKSMRCVLNLLSSLSSCPAVRSAALLASRSVVQSSHLETLYDLSWGCRTYVNAWWVGRLAVVLGLA